MLGRGRFLVLFIVSGLLASGCVQPPEEPSDSSSSPSPSVTRTAPAGPFAVSSPAFQHAAAIPRKYTCDADNVSPPLDFGGIPLNATTIALIMDDPDAPSGTVLHWTFWNLPWNVTTLPEKAAMDSYGARQGQKYRGPCPPAGSHRYFFYAYAVNGTLDLAEGGSVTALRAALQGRVAAQSQMYGTYLRPAIPPI